MNENLLDLQDDLPKIDENKKYLEEYVGPGRKYADQESLAKAYAHAENLIKIQNDRADALRQDALKLREENLAQPKLQEIVDQLKKQLTSNELPLVKEDEKPAAMQIEDIQKIIATQIQSQKVADQEAINFRTFRTKLTERFGSNETALNQQIDSLGISKDDLIALAKKSPTAAIKTLGLDSQEKLVDYQAPMQSNQRNTNFAPSGAKEKTWSYWQEEKKRNKDWLYDSKFTNAMQRSAIELGDKFYDGDFYLKGLHER